MEINIASFQNTLIIIPVYNGANELPELLLRIRSTAPLSNILCINDGSIDHSCEIMKENHLQYLSWEKNRGKGYALKKGLQFAKKSGYKFALSIDADLQHDPKIIPRFLITQNKEQADLVIGFRKFSWKNMPWLRVLSNTITSYILSKLLNNNILDSQSGYRLYNLKLFWQKEISTDQYQMETEILLEYTKKGAKLAFVEIPVLYHKEISHIAHGRDVVNFCKLICQKMGRRNW